MVALVCFDAICSGIWVKPLSVVLAVLREMIVKGVFLYLFLFFGPPLFAEVSIKAEIDRRGGYENSPVTGLIMIGHGAEEEIDKNSFLLDKSPLQVELVKEESVGAKGQLIAIFRFTLPPQPKGAYLLPAITVAVGGKQHRSVPSTYEIMAADKAVQTGVQGSSAQPPAGFQPSLSLQAFVNGPEEIYPGQKTIVGYRYIYNANIDTTKEQIPLLQAEGLIKVGEQLAKEAQEGNLTVLEISQIIQGDAPGVYTFGPSILEGMPYQMDASGRKIYAKQKLTSEAKPVTITVKPFPVDGRPQSFTGAVGEYHWDAALLSNPQIQVGDRVILNLTVSGSGDVQGLVLPELCCQPGMSGLFRLSDLPPVGKIDGAAKKFTVEMRALSAAIQEVPSFEFSSFDPATGKYLLFHTAPIPLTVVASAETPLPEPPKVSSSPSLQWQQELDQVDGLEIEGYDALAPADLNDRYFGTWWTLFLIPFGVGFLIFQGNLAEYIAKEKEKSKLKSIGSGDIFVAGEKAASGSLEQYVLWKKAFILRLFEQRLIDSENMPLENLPTEGPAGEVRALLLAMQRERYSGEKNQADHSSRELEVKTLFNLLANRRSQ